MTTENIKVRPSSLPKLALCGQYQGVGGASDAAKRGTRLDAMFRKAWAYGELSWFDADEDVDPVRWALNECIRLGGGVDGLTTDEAACRVSVPGIEHVGTADGVAVRGRWLVDLKSGQEYDYQAQMAAYALGLMEKHGWEVWTTHLLFCDQKKTVSTVWTRQAAWAVVQKVLENVGTAPVENEYCGWCAKSLTCTARIRAQEAALVPVREELTVESTAFLQVLQDPEALGRFLQSCKTLEDFVDAAKDKAREYLADGKAVPGWRLGAPRALDYLAAEHIAADVNAGVLRASEVVLACGNMPSKRARELYQAAGAAFPAEAEVKKQSAAPLVASKK